MINYLLIKKMKKFSKVSKSKFKKQSQIFNLKNILNDANNESYLLYSKITELKKLFKTTRKIINEKINELAKKKNNPNINDSQIKLEICNILEQLIKKYKTGKNVTSINNKKEEDKKILTEKSNNLNALLKQLKFKKIQKEKDLLIQTVKEKHSINYILKNQIEYEKDLNSIFQPKNYVFFEDLYNMDNKFMGFYLKKSKKKKVIDIINHNKKYLKEIGMMSITDLKENKNNYIRKFNNYITEKGFNFVFHNNRDNEIYNINSELINEYEYSSDSEYEIDVEDSNNNILFINHNIIKNNKNNESNENNENSNLKINNMIKNPNNKKISLSSSEKDTNDQEKDIKNNDNTILVNKLVEIKEKYNKLINEKYDLDYQLNLIKKKIKYAKLQRNAISCTSLSIQHASFSQTKFKKSCFNKL